MIFFCKKFDRFVFGIMLWPLRCMSMLSINKFYQQFGSLSKNENSLWKIYALLDIYLEPGICMGFGHTWMESTFESLNLAWSFTSIYISSRFWAPVEEMKICTWAHTGWKWGEAFDYINFKKFMMLLGYLLCRWFILIFTIEIHQYSSLLLTFSAHLSWCVLIILSW